MSTNRTNTMLAKVFVQSSDRRCNW